MYDRLPYHIYIIGIISRSEFSSELNAIYDINSVMYCSRVHNVDMWRGPNFREDAGVTVCRRISDAFENIPPR